MGAQRPHARNEFIADDEAVTIIGGDAEAAVSALANLARLNQQPAHWGRLDENTSTHPSGSRRIQAIMDENEMDPERLAAILEKLDRDEDRYPLPADLLRDERLLFTDFRSRRALFVQWLTLALLILLPALVARGIVGLGWHGAMAWAAFAGGILSSLLRLTTLMGYAAVWGERRLCSRLSGKWKSAEFDVAAWEAAFVALAPARAPRLYEGRFEWDMGFLLLRNDRMCYLGCQTCFALPRNHITAIRLGPGVPRWGKSSRIYLTWRDDQGTETTWNLRPAGVVSRRVLESPDAALDPHITRMASKAGDDRLVTVAAVLFASTRHRQNYVRHRGIRPPGESAYAIRYTFTRWVRAGLLFSSVVRLTWFPFPVGAGMHQPWHA